MRLIYFLLFLGFFSPSAYAAGHAQDSSHQWQLNCDAALGSIAALSPFYHESPGAAMQDALDYFEPSYGGHANFGVVVDYSTTFPPGPRLSWYINHVTCYAQFDNIGTFGEVCGPPDYLYVEPAGTCPMSEDGEATGQTQCPDGHWVNPGETCDENSCPELRGNVFSYDFDPNVPTASHGYVNGCEFAIYRYDGGSRADYCLTGNGSYSESQTPEVMWVGGTVISGAFDNPVSTACPENLSPTPRPRFCPSTITGYFYDAQCTDEDGGDNTTDAPVSYLPPLEFVPNPVTTPTPSAPEIPSVPPITPPGDTTPTMPTIPTTPGSGSSPVPVDGSGSWGAFPTIPSDGFYSRNYTSLQDVYSDFQSDFASTGLGDFLGSFSLPDGSGTRPEWFLDLSNVMGFDFGIHDISIPEWIWIFLRACILLSTFVACRRIIFGG